MRRERSPCKRSAEMAASQGAAIFLDTLMMLVVSLDFVWQPDSPDGHADPRGVCFSEIFFIFPLPKLLPEEIGEMSSHAAVYFPPVTHIVNDNGAVGKIKLVYDAVIANSPPPSALSA